MEKQIFAICDLESAYAYKFMEYLTDRKKVPFQIEAFTNTEALCQFAQKQEVEILLISNKAVNERIKKLKIRKIIILSEGEVIPELNVYPAVYKYQSSDSLIREVLNYYSEEESAGSTANILKKKMEIIGIYSPIQRTLKTSFALTLGQVLGKEKKTLYLNLESYSGFAGLANKLQKKNYSILSNQAYDADLSDLLYYIRQGKENIVMKLNSMIESMNGFDYVPPVLYPTDITNTDAGDWESLLDVIIHKSAYDALVIDFAEGVRGIFDLLKKCTKIYMPVKEDAVSIAKLQQYENFIQTAGYTELVEKTQKLKLPYHNSFGTKEDYFEQLLWGELGDYVKELRNGSGKDITGRYANE